MCAQLHPCETQNELCLPMRHKTTSRQHLERERESTFGGEDEKLAWLYALPVRDECHAHLEQAKQAHAKHFGNQQSQEGHHQHMEVSSPSVRNKHVKIRPEF